MGLFRYIGDLFLIVFLVVKFLLLCGTGIGFPFAMRNSFNSQ